MGSSYVDLHGQGFWTRDGLLQIWLFALAEEARRTAGPPWLNEAADFWTEQARHGFTGCVWANLDRWIGGDADARLLEGISGRTLEGLRRRGSLLDGVWLNGLGLGPDGSTWGDLELWRVEAVGLAFERLLEGLSTREMVGMAPPQPTDALVRHRFPNGSDAIAFVAGRLEANEVDALADECTGPGEDRRPRPDGPTRRESRVRAIELLAACDREIGLRRLCEDVEFPPVHEAVPIVRLDLEQLAGHPVYLDLTHGRAGWELTWIGTTDDLRHRMRVPLARKRPRDHARSGDADSSD